MPDQGRGILFACNLNSIRSPMAEALARKMLGERIKIASCGVYQGGEDPFLPEILAEEGIDITGRESQCFAEMSAEEFGVVIALTPEAADAARDHFADSQIEFWDVPNPTDEHGSRERLLDAYRTTRQALKKRIAARFGGV